MLECVKLIHLINLRWCSLNRQVEEPVLHLATQVGAACDSHPPTCTPIVRLYPRLEDQLWFDNCMVTTFSPLEVNQNSPMVGTGEKVSPYFQW